MCIASYEFLPRASRSISLKVVLVVVVVVVILVLVVLVFKWSHFWSKAFGGILTIAYCPVPHKYIVVTINHHT